MSPKAKRFLWGMATLLVVVAFFGVLCLKTYQNSNSLAAQKVQLTQKLDQLSGDNASKQKDLDDSKTDDWVKQQAHELGMVSQGEVKIVDGSK
jgi:cell division protein FtsB